MGVRDTDAVHVILIVRRCTVPRLLLPPAPSDTGGGELGRVDLHKSVGDVFVDSFLEQLFDDLIDFQHPIYSKHVSRAR